MSSLKSRYVTIVVGYHHTQKKCTTVQMEVGISGRGELIRGSRSCRIGRAWRSGSPYPSWVDASGKGRF